MRRRYRFRDRRWFRRDPSSPWIHIAKLRDTFRDLQPKHRFTPQKFSFLDNPAPGVRLNNLYLQTDLGPVDLLDMIKGVGEFEAVRALSIEIELFGRHAPSSRLMA